MLAVFRDAVWPSIGAFLALIALLVSLWIYRKQKARKILVWTQSSFPLLSIDKSLQDELTITYRNYAVTAAYMASITLANRGNTPIPRQDYDKPITIVLSDGGEMVSLDYSENNTIEITATVTSPGTITIEPFLLNPNDEVTIRTVIINNRPRIDTKARIVGGTLMDEEGFQNTLEQRVRKSLVNYGGQATVVFIVIMVFIQLLAAGAVSIYLAMFK